MSRWDGPVSVVEDLDPEPEQPPGRSQRRDLVLGLLILAGVLVFAGWQWWYQETRQSNYTAAVEALERRDLDEARSLFAEASGYRDADSRAGEVDRRIALRDSLYKAATSHIAVKDWVAGLADLRALHKIQPSYRASSHLERMAVAEIGSQALEHGVAQREPPGGPAGLYYRRDSEWLYLPGSDLDSRVRGYGSVGLLVYDAPAASGGGKARTILLANFLGPEPVSTVLPFDPNVYGDFRWNEQGVWAFRYGQYSTPGRAPVTNAMHGVEAAFMRFGSSATYNVAFENTGGAMGEVLVDVDLTSDHYLMASWTGAARLSSEVLSNTVVSLSAATAGSPPRMIYATTGVGIDGARLSRDGRYALVTTYTSPPGAGSVYRLLLFDLQSGGQPQQLDGVRARNLEGDEGRTRWISSTFIDSGAYEGNVLAAVFNYDHTHLRMYDPALPEEPLFDVEVPTPTGLQWAVSRADERGLVVNGALSTYSPPYGRSDAQTVPVVEISASGHATQTGVLVNKSGTPRAVDLAPDHLAVVSVLSEEDTYIWIVNSVPAGNAGQAQVRPTTIYTQYVPGSVGLKVPAPVNVGDGLLVYVEDESLRVRTYDGGIDVPLEEGVRVLYPRRYVHDRTPVLR